MDDKADLLHALRIDRSQPAPARKSRTWLFVALALGAGAVIWRSAPDVAALWQAPPPALAKSSEPPPPVLPSVASRAATGLVASGYVVARRKAIIASQITGKVSDLLVEEGDVVKAGDVLARLDSTLARIDLDLARSRLATIEAALAAITPDLREAERALARGRTLSMNGITTEAELGKLDAKALVLRAQQRQNTAQVASARLDASRSAEVLEQHFIRAPFAGVVVERSAQPGEMISPNSGGGGFTRTGICLLVDMESIEIEVDVNEAYIGRARKGGAITAVLDAYPDWSIRGAVIAVVPTANRDKATVKVRVSLAEKDPRILPDMAVKVTFLDEVAASADLEPRTVHQ